MQIQKKAVDLTDLAIGIVVLGIFVSIGAYILTNLRDSKLTDLTVLTKVNEVLTFTGNTATLTNTWGRAVINVTNGTTGNIVAPGNYSVSISSVDGTISITNLTSTLQPWNVSYTYYNTTSRPDYTLANQSAIGLGEYGNWFKIIVIVGVASLVLGIIFMSFGRGSTSQSGGSY
jgi:hypothetical protein